MYRTCSHTSPCVKMVAPRAYSTTLFATPDESRNACALNGGKREDLAGFAAPGVRAVDDLMPTTVARCIEARCSELNSAMLSEEGYTVARAETGHRGRSTAKTHP